MAMFDWLENKVQDHVFGVASFTMPTNRYVGLCSSAPQDDNTIAQVEAIEVETIGTGSYTRPELITADAAGSGAFNPGQIKNSAVLSFLTSTTDWATSTHAFTTDSPNLTTGNPFHHAGLASPRSGTTGTKITFNIGELDFTLD